MARWSIGKPSTGAFFVPNLTVKLSLSFPAGISVITITSSRLAAAPAPMGDEGPARRAVIPS
jgi:hypothetical protein